MGGVRIWEETVTIPTYNVGMPDKNPMFLEKRVYQGSSGAVYPYPVIDRVGDVKLNRPYRAVFLENRYLKIMVLPELGGRVQMALDKTNDYHFIYYNRVIKPALVGLAGPWISGGIEFNWPQHHRPSTFHPTDFTVLKNEDGSQTLWVSEIERMSRMRALAGFTLYPERAVLEVKVRLYNRTEVPQTFLWWANPAVAANEHYQSVFPPDVHAVMDHGKRAVSSFPIAKGTYYKVNYAPGTDISWYKNIPVPTSFMAYHSDFDFVGGYDHARQAGMLHVADHHLVPGKKQWTWGSGDFGQAWDRQLTDDDGPYVELMCGGFSDNQPDFSWLQPYEEKSFSQFFLPYKGIGLVKNASTEAALNLELNGRTAQLGVYVTQPRRVSIQLSRAGRNAFAAKAALGPESAWNHEVKLKGAIRATDLTLRLLDEQGQELLSFTPLPEAPIEMPKAAEATKRPSEITSTEELYLNGLHLEQYRHATYAPEPYYEEALRRDPNDSRAHNAIGLLWLRRGRFERAEEHFRRAIASLTRRNPNPYDGEAFYHLGLTLRHQERWTEAFDAFYKSAWNAAWQDATYFELARLACREGQFEEALELVQRSLERNSNHHKARHLQLVLLRGLEREIEAQREIETALALDPLNFGALYERRLWRKDGEFERLIANNPQNYVEVALDYAYAGRFREADALLREAPGNDPLAKYYRGWIKLQEKDVQAAKRILKEAAKLPATYCFPHQLECVPALQAAMRLEPADCLAPYLLGTFWYSRRQYSEAIVCWERARKLNPRFPTVHRNLGLAYYNQLKQPRRAKAAFVKAIAADLTDARVLFELDQLDKRLSATPAQRLQRLERHPDLVEKRDDLTVELITLLNLEGRHSEALERLQQRNFHPWEGGEGKVTRQYVEALVGLAKARIKAGDSIAAIDDLQRAKSYPPNLGEGKLYGAHENQIDYWLGVSFGHAGDQTNARECFRRATEGPSEPTEARFYNDQPPDLIFYQGLAWLELKRPFKARTIFRRLADYGRQHLGDRPALDYFAVSLPDFLVFDEDLRRRNQIHCHYLIGLGLLGLRRLPRARSEFQAALAMDPAHQGARIHLEMTR